jgi:hypothetical protein
MTAFIEDPGNQTCESDSDCVATSTGCADVEIGLCGQVPLNRSAAQSPAWRSLTDAANDCETSCSQCAAALVPGCNEGRCFRPEDAAEGD